MTLIIVFYHCNYSGEPFGSFDGKAIGIVDSSAEVFGFCCYVLVLFNQRVPAFSQSDS